MARQAPQHQWTTTSRILGWILARRREALHLSQDDLGRALGIGQSAWSRIELGENALTTDALQVVASVLGLAASEVLRQAEDHALRLEAAGVRVVNERKDVVPSSGGAFLAGAALTGLIVAALMGPTKRK